MVGDAQAGEAVSRLISTCAFAVVLETRLTAPAGAATELGTAALCAEVVAALACGLAELEAPFDFCAANESWLLLIVNTVTAVQCSKV